MSGSLNAGFELDGELGVQDRGEEPKPKEVELEPVEIDVSPEAVPDLTHDLNTIATLEARIDDLQFLMSDIRKSHGMSQQFAMEAERLLPGFGSVPLAYYSKDISATRYQVSMEELSKGMWALIAAACAAVIAIIYKFIKWLSGGKGEANGAAAGGGSVESAVESVKEEKEALKETGETLRNVADAASHVSNIEITDEKGRTETANHLTDFILHVFKDKGAKYDHSLAFLTSTNPYYHDIINHGVYTVTVGVAILNIDFINDALRQKLDFLEKIVHADQMDSASTQQKLMNDAGLQVVSKPIIIKVKGKDASVTELADNVAKVRQETGERKSHQSVRFEQALARLAAAHQDHRFERFLENMEVSIRTFDDMQKQLTALEKKVGDVSDDGQNGHNSEGIAGKLREVISAVGRDISSTARLESEIKHYLRYMHEMEREATGLSIETAREIQGLYKRDRETPPPNIQKFLEAVEAAEEAKKKKKKGILNILKRRK